MSGQRGQGRRGPHRNPISQGPDLGLPDSRTTGTYFLSFKSPQLWRFVRAARLTETAGFCVASTALASTALASSPAPASTLNSRVPAQNSDALGSLTALSACGRCFGFDFYLILFYLVNPQNQGAEAWPSPGWSGLSLVGALQPGLGSPPPLPSRAGRGPAPQEGAVWQGQVRGSLCQPKDSRTGLGNLQLRQPGRFQNHLGTWERWTPASMAGHVEVLPENARLEPHPPGLPVGKSNAVDLFQNHQPASDWTSSGCL